MSTPITRSELYRILESKGYDASASLVEECSKNFFKHLGMTVPVWVWPAIEKWEEEFRTWVDAKYPSLHPPLTLGGQSIPD